MPGTACCTVHYCTCFKGFAGSDMCPPMARLQLRARRGALCCLSRTCAELEASSGWAC